MYDRERIVKIVSDLEKYFRDLEELNIEVIADIEAKRNFYALSMVLFSILNRTIDLGNEIVMANNFGMPSTYKDIFRLLAKNGIIERELEKKMSNLVFYRNLLSHEYYALTEVDVFDIFERINVVKQFLEKSKNIVTGNVEE